MTAAEIGRLAYEHQQQGEVPDRVIVRCLSEMGIEGEVFEPAYRDAYEACEREWRRIWREQGREDGITCAYCGQSLNRQQTKWCSRACWSRARAKRAHHDSVPERDAEIVRLREEGLLLREIAERFGISYARVNQILRREAA